MASVISAQSWVSLTTPFLVPVFKCTIGNGLEFLTALPPMSYHNSSTSTSVSNASSKACSSPPPPSLVALPSLTHSLAALPNMASLPRDMIHYSNTGVSSRTKLEQALKQQQTRAGNGQPYLAHNDVRRTPSPAPSCQGGEDAYITVRSKQHASRGDNIRHPRR